MPYDDPVIVCKDYVPQIDLGRPVNFKSPCYVIAEIGQNHQGDMMMAKKLIKLAKVSSETFSKLIAIKSNFIIYLYTYIFICISGGSEGGR